MGCGSSSDTKNQTSSESKAQKPVNQNNTPQQKPAIVAQPVVQSKVLMMGILSSDYPQPSSKDTFIDEEFPGDAAMPEDIIEGQGQWINMKDSCGDGFFNFITDQQTLISNGGYSTYSMLVALEALMSNPNICQMIFIDLNPSLLNYFRVQLFDSDGNPSQTIIDHYVACDAEGQSLYVRCTNSVLPIFLEKAYAKFKQGYYITEDVPNIIQTFTGCPFDSYSINLVGNENGLKDKIQESLNEGHLVFVKTDGNESLGFTQETLQVLNTGVDTVTIRRVSSQSQYQGRLAVQNSDQQSRIELNLEKPYDIVIGIEELHQLTMKLQICLVSQNTRNYILPSDGTKLIVETFELSSAGYVRFQVKSSTMAHYFLAKFDPDNQVATSIVMKQLTYNGDISTFYLENGNYIFIAKEGPDSQENQEINVNFSASICDRSLMFRHVRVQISDQQKDRIIDSILQLELLQNPDQLTYPLLISDSFEQYIGERAGYFCIFVRNISQSLILRGQTLFNNPCYLQESDVEIYSDGFTNFYLEPQQNFFIKYALQSYANTGSWKYEDVSSFYMFQDAYDSSEKIWQDFDNLVEQEIREFGEGEQVIVKKSKRHDGFYIYYFNQGQQTYEELLEFSNLYKVTLLQGDHYFVDETHAQITIQPNEKKAIVLPYQDCQPRDYADVSFEMTVIKAGPVVQNAEQ